MQSLNLYYLSIRILLACKSYKAKEVTQLIHQNVDSRFTLKAHSLPVVLQLAGNDRKRW